ncbi:MAG: D-2-hydroxyacid dehydrogenase [Chthoniobacterales bacterium]|nr:D-2-hydroxyacid dehydrogenase [Chthoniobacterales bacterium]
MKQHHRIVVLDEGHLLDGNLPWGEVADLGELTVYKHTAEADVVARARGAQIILTNKTPITAETLAALPGLKFIGVLATGHNVVDSSAARTHGITVSNVPAYGTDSAAQHVFALILELCNRVGLHAQFVARGDWSASREWCAPQTAVTELSGLTLGLIGRGRIAKRVAEIGGAFGMEALMASPSKPEGGGELSALDRVIREADVLSLHCQLTPANAGMINSTLLGKMKAGSFLINTARGGLIKEVDLAQALRRGPIAGAGLDVLTVEPPPADHPLCTLPNCIITPHMAWTGPRARQRLLEVTAQNIRAFLQGKPINVVNP